MHDHGHVSEQQRTRPQESPRAAQHPHSTQMEREQHRHDPFTAGAPAPDGGPHAPEPHAHMVADFRRWFWVSLVLTVPIIVLSPMLQDWFGLGTVLRFPGDTWVQLGFSTAVFFYGGWPFLTGLFNELHERQPGMMTLISMAISVAYGYSTAVVFGLRGVPFFWEMATLIDIMLLGHWIEMRSVMGASAALESLVRLMPSEAHRLRPDGSTEEVPISALQPGDRVLIKPGEKVPTDGMIVAGRTSLNEAMLTGESRPVEKGEGDQAIGGSVNGESAITVEVQKTGDQTYLAQVIDLVRKAQESRSRTQDLANRAALPVSCVLSGGQLRPSPCRWHLPHWTSQSGNSKEGRE